EISLHVPCGDRGQTTFRPFDLEFGSFEPAALEFEFARLTGRSIHYQRKSLRRSVEGSRSSAGRPGQLQVCHDLPPPTDELDVSPVRGEVDRHPSCEDRTMTLGESHPDLGTNQALGFVLEQKPPRAETKVAGIVEGPDLDGSREP